MFRKLTTVLAFALMTMGLLAPSASAAVSFDPSTGTGFVGKGDIQILFGWNNATLQKNASGITFTYETIASYEATCTFTTGEGTRGEKTHNVGHKASTSVYGQVAYDARTMKQITGFTLTGLGGTITIGDETAPVVGEPCPGNQGHDGTWTSVTLISESGGLWVHYGGVSYPLPNTPVL